MMERTQTVEPRADVANRISEVPTQRSPEPAEAPQPTETRSLLPTALITGGYATLVGITTAIICIV